MADQSDKEIYRGERFSITRRGLLGTALGGAVAALLQACRRAIPTPTPTPPPTAPPTVAQPPTATSSATSSATAVPPTLTATSESGEVFVPIARSAEHTATPTTATATASPVPPPTATPGPTNTPVPPPPTATPFPPGPQTKLGLFVGYQHPALEALLRTGNVPFVKTLEYDPNLVEFIKRISPTTIVVARYTPLGPFSQVSGEPTEIARRFVDLLLPIATEPKRFANIDAWESYNEPGPTTREAMQRFAAFEAERVRLLAEAGIRSCIGNFATGMPPLELWPDFFPAVQAAKETNGYLGLHEYSAPYMWFGTGQYQMNPEQDEGDEGWLTLRYRKVYRNYLQPNGLELPLVITETGIDGQVQPRPGPQGLGWQDFQGHWLAEGKVGTTSAGFYMEQLAWYDAELQQDEYVKGASIYALAAPTGWGSFEISGALTDLFKQYLEVHPRRG